MNARWVIRAIPLFILLAAIYPGWRMMHPSTPSYFETARAHQSTPVDTVNAMFELMKSGPSADVSIRLHPYSPFDSAHLLTARDMSVGEQKFADLFWDHLCSAVIYTALSEHMEKEPSITDHSESGDSAKVTVSVPVDSDDGKDPICTFELKKRGDNWHIAEMTSPKSPVGIYQAFKQQMGTAP